MLEKAFLDSVEKAMTLDSYGQGLALLKDIQNRLEVDHIAYANHDNSAVRPEALLFGNDAAPPKAITENIGKGLLFSQSTYSQDWVERYVDQDYLLIDPVVRNAVQNALPHEWYDGVSLQSKKVTQFRQESLDFGLGDKGITIPIRGQSGEIGMLIVNSKANDKDWSAFKNQSLGNLVMFAMYYHEAMQNLSKARSRRKFEQLSNREIETLQWVACGKTNWETSVIMNLSESTIKFHLTKIRKKLDCDTTPQAVARAIFLGYIETCY